MSEIVKQMEVAAARVAHLKSSRGKTLALVEKILKGSKS
jgi:hypothetical protein